jgi:transglutaminase-like putative cysteine protease
MGFVYVIACVLAAATANVRNEMFYAGAAVFAAWSLWNLRSRRYPRIVPFAMLMLASVLGYAGHIGLNQFQGALTEWVGELMDRSVNTNPFRSHSQIGQIGALKTSDRIVMRVRLPAEQQVPLLLHRASYNVFYSPNWVARPVKFEPVPGDSVQGWSLRAASPGKVGESANAMTPAITPALRRDRAVEVLDYARNGKTILALPLGTAWLDGLPPAELRRSSFGSTNVETAPGFMRYRAHVGAGASVEGPPTDADLRIPPAERVALRAIAAELGLYGLGPAEARRRVERFFFERFRYSTWQEVSSPQVMTPLAAFLTRTRTGHCEYFASATTLLLREAGIAARYATGFSVQERSAGDDFLVRERHAHAWTRAWIGGAWVDIDTTPPQWFGVEGGEGSLWETLGDAWSWLRFAWGRYQTDDDAAVPRPVLIGLLAMLFAWLAWRIVRRPAGRAQDKPAARSATPVIGADSEFYRIEKLFAARNLARERSEPLSAWLARLARSGVGAETIEELRGIVALHYRLRFDPRPMDAAARDELRARVERWLSAAQGLPV